MLLASTDSEGTDMLPITKLADFGTVREDVRHRKLSAQTTSTNNIESHAVTKQVIGTRPYMSLGDVLCATYAGAIPNWFKCFFRPCVFFCFITTAMYPRIYHVRERQREN